MARRTRATPPTASAAATAGASVPVAGLPVESGEGTEQGSEQASGSDDEAEADKLAELEQYPLTDVLRNNSSGEFACRETGLFLSPGASRTVTVRDAEHMAVLAEAIAVFDRTQPRAGLLKFDGVAL